MALDVVNLFPVRRQNCKICSSVFTVQVQHSMGMGHTFSMAAFSRVWSGTTEFWPPAWQAAQLALKIFSPAPASPADQKTYR